MPSCRWIFARAEQELKTLSADLSLLAANGAAEFRFGGLYLNGDGSSDLQVFTLDGSQVLQAHTFQVSGIPDGASVVFNIDGERAGLTNMSMSSLMPHRGRVLLNFHQAERLTLNGIGVEGSVLAPWAVIDEPQGVIHGTLIARSWSGSMQLNHLPFSGDLGGVGNDKARGERLPIG